MIVKKKTITIELTLDEANAAYKNLILQATQDLNTGCITLAPERLLPAKLTPYKVLEDIATIEHQLSYIKRLALEWKGL